MQYSLFLDGERFPDGVKWVEYPRRDWKIARNFDQFVFYVENTGMPEFISLDHDLGMDPRTGMDCVKWLLAYCERTHTKFPAYKIHSQNLVGRDNMAFLIENYKKHMED